MKARGPFFSAALLAAASIVSLTLGSSSNAAGPVTEFSVGGAANAMTEGPDGNMWMILNGNIARISSTGEIAEEFDPQLGGNSPDDLVAGSGDELWFSHVNGIGRLSLAGEVEDYHIDGLDYGGGPNSITLGGDGSVWYVLGNGRFIGRTTEGGTQTDFGFIDGFQGWGIATDGEGNIWVSDHATDRLARVSLSGSIDYFTVPAAYDIRYLTGSPTGEIWFGDDGGFGSIDPDGNSSFFPLDEEASPYEIDVAKNGDIWFTDDFVGTNRVGRFTTDGELEWFELPTPNAYPTSIAIHGKYVWFTEPAVGKIARIRLDGSEDPDPPAPPPDLIGTKEKIAFLGYGPGQSHRLFVMDADGSDVRLLKDRVDFTDLAWSPDAKTVAWSPDAKTVAVALLPKKASNRKRGLYIVNVRTGRHRLLLKAPYSQYFWSLGWSPDGRKLLFEAGQDRIGYVNIKSRAVTLLPQGAESIQDLNPVWSPRGDHIAFTECYSENIYGVACALSIVSDALRGKKRLLQTSEGGCRPGWPASWSPSGRKVAVTRVCGGKTGVWVVGVGGSGSRVVRKFYDQLAWSPGGHFIAGANTYSLSPRLQLMTTSGENAMERQIGFDPTWSPDGKYMAFSDRDGAIRVVVAKTGEIFPVRADPAFELSWSPR